MKHREFILQQIADYQKYANKVKDKTHKATILTCIETLQSILENYDTSRRIANTVSTEDERIPCGGC